MKIILYILSGLFFINCTSSKERHSSSLKKTDLLWKKNIGNGIPYISSLIIKDGALYFASNDSSVYSVNSKNGNVIWRYETSQMIESTPFLEKGTLFFGSDDSCLYVLNEKDGILKQKFKATGHIVTNVKCLNNLIFFGGTDSSFYCFNTLSGNLEWKTKLSEWIYHSHILFNGTIYAPCENTIVGLDSKNGKIVNSTTLKKKENITYHVL